MPTRQAGRYPTRPRFTRYSVRHPEGPDEHHSYAPAPGLALEMAAQGVTLEALSEITGYPQDYLRRLRDENLIAPRIVTSRIAAVLGVETPDIRGNY
jgi:hypothetical protein